MRLIDADALKERIRRFLSIKSLDDLLPEEKAIVQHIDRMPTVDAVPVRHGRWETDGMMMDECEFLMTRCTACGGTYEYGFNMPFCPNCGARMDGKDGEQV